MLYEVPAGGSPTAPGRITGNGTRPHAFLGDSPEVCVGSLRVNASAWAPGDAFSMWARVPCAQRSLHG